MRAEEVHDFLPQVQAPCLVVHRRESLSSPLENSVRLAQALPNAPLRVIEGEGGGPWDGDVPEAVRIVTDFLQDQTPVERGAPTRERSNLPLTPSQVEVLRLIATGMSNQRIADELVISRNTVIRHVDNIFTKIGVANRVEVTTYAIRHGLGN
jgi:DNA-binding CsgD family transcriptional regulator